MVESFWTLRGHIQLTSIRDIATISEIISKNLKRLCNEQLREKYQLATYCDYLQEALKNEIQRFDTTINDIENWSMCEVLQAPGDTNPRKNDEQTLANHQVSIINKHNGITKNVTEEMMQVIVRLSEIKNIFEDSRMSEKHIKRPSWTLMAEVERIIKKSIKEIKQQRIRLSHFSSWETAELWKPFINQQDLIDELEKLARTRPENFASFRKNEKINWHLFNKKLFVTKSRTEEELLFEIKVPMIQNKTNFIYKAIPVPLILDNDTYAVVKLQREYMVVNRDDNNFSWIDKQEDNADVNEHFFNLPATRYPLDSKVCIGQLFTSEEPTECNYEYHKFDKEIWISLREGISWFYASPKLIKAQLECENLGKHRITLNSGAGKLSLKENCHIDTEWASLQTWKPSEEGENIIKYVKISPKRLEELRKHQNKTVKKPEEMTTEKMEIMIENQSKSNLKINEFEVGETALKLYVLICCVAGLTFVTLIGNIIFLRRNRMINDDRYKKMIEETRNFHISELEKFKSKKSVTFGSINKVNSLPGLTFTSSLPYDKPISPYAVVLKTRRNRKTLKTRPGTYPPVILGRTLPNSYENDEKMKSYNMNDTNSE